MVKLSAPILAVFRTAAKANSYTELETAIPFARLRATCTELVEAHERAVRQATERKQARRWAPRQDEALRLGVRKHRTIGEMAEELDRTPLAVRNRLVVLGLLNFVNIRPASTERPKSSPKSDQLDPANHVIHAESAPMPEITSAIRSCDSSEDELLDRHAEELAREQAEADRIREEEAQTELEELQAAADARAAEEQAALDDLPEEEAA